MMTLIPQLKLQLRSARARTWLLCLAAFVLGLGATVRPGAPEAAALRPTPAPSTDPTLKDFLGTNHLLPPDLDQRLGIGMARIDFAWRAIEPQPGQWSWDKTDEAVRNAQSQGVDVLPALAYAPEWAVGPGKRAFDTPLHVQDWTDFVDKTVARYSRPPFNLKYFQVWNEPTRAAGFFTGGDNTYVDVIYIPAAKIIHHYGAKVVFGGWPESNSLQEYDAVLNYHEAWRETDILDIHYRDALSDWIYLYDRWIATGKCHGIWETEIGFVSAPNFLPGTYIQHMHWALENGWDQPDQYKLFWYQASCSGAEADKCLSKLQGGKLVLTQHGYRLAAMNDVLGGGALSLYSNFSLSPSRANAGGIAAGMGFRVGSSRYVVALQLQRAAYGRDRALNISMPLPERPAKAEVVTAAGQHQALQGSYSGGRFQAAVPLEGIMSECATCGWGIGYVNVEE